MRKSSGIIGWVLATLVLSYIVIVAAVGALADLRAIAPSEMTEVNKDPICMDTPALSMSKALGQVKIFAMPA